VGSASIEALSAYAEDSRPFRRPPSGARRWTARSKDSSFALAELALANDAFSRQDADEGDRWCAVRTRTPSV
jgi:hypothetical protein